MMTASRRCSISIALRAFSISSEGMPASSASGSQSGCSRTARVEESLDLETDYSVTHSIDREIKTFIHIDAGCWLPRLKK